MARAFMLHLMNMTTPRSIRVGFLPGETGGTGSYAGGMLSLMPPVFAR